MFASIKQGLLKSYVGAIGLGWLLATTISHFANIFAAPIANSITRGELNGFAGHSISTTGFQLQDSIPELVRFAICLLIWGILLRWLYLSPGEPKSVPDLTDTDSALGANLS